MADWINFDTTVYATGSITIVDQGGNTTDINQLHGTNGFVLTDTAGTAVEYIFDKNNALGATGTIHSDGTVIQVNGMSSASDVANEVMEAIVSEGGHAGTITCSLSSNVVNLTQEVNAPDGGNNTIAVGSTPTPSYISYTGFSNGSVARYLYPMSHLNAVHLTSSTQIKMYLRNPNQPTEAVSDDIITITCQTDLGVDVYNKIINKLSSKQSQSIINIVNDADINTIVYTAGT